MIIIAVISFAALAAGTWLTWIARSPPVANLGMFVASVGGVCLVLSLLALSLV